MVKQELLNKVIDLYKASYVNSGVCVFVNTDVVDVDRPSIWINEDILYFEFNDDDIENFEINVKDIKEITFDKFDNSSIIQLADGNIIAIHNL